MRILYAGTRRSGEMRSCAAIYATVSVVLTALFLLLNANLAKKTGVNRIMYPEIEFAGVPLFADVSQDTTLDFLDETPGVFVYRGDSTSAEVGAEFFLNSHAEAY